MDLHFDLHMSLHFALLGGWTMGGLYFRGRYCIAGCTDLSLQSGKKGVKISIKKGNCGYDGKKRRVW